MKKYRVYIELEVEVEAETPEEAEAIAREGIDEESFDWVWVEAEELSEEG